LLSDARPKDYDDRIEQIIPTYDENEKTFKPPEFSYRMGMKLDSYENFKAWGYISSDQRMLLSDEGEVYLRMDEQTFGSPPISLWLFALRMVVEYDQLKIVFQTLTLVSRGWFNGIFVQVSSIG